MSHALSTALHRGVEVGTWTGSIAAPPAPPGWSALLPRLPRKPRMGRQGPESPRLTGVCPSGTCACPPARRPSELF